MKLDPSGFREYDARWLYPEQIDDEGMKRLGFALGELLAAEGKSEIIVGHDYRSYSAAVKQALMAGLSLRGINITDIGLCLSPTAYFAQSHLGIDSVAMVTASHNENGWTGVKMGCAAPLTFGPQEMERLKDFALANTALPKSSTGKVRVLENIQDAYCADLISKADLKRPLKVVLACGNGTAALFAPRVFEAVGCEVIPLHCELDWDFPHYTPNPENMKMMEDLAASVRANGADVGLAFDGDGDRCGFVDEAGNIIFADKMGVLIARHLSTQQVAGQLVAGQGGAKFIADVKSTGLFLTDPVLQKNNATTTYWKTGHSYMKRRVNETGALAGFEKSGHFFFAPPIGRGYDDGILSGLLICALIAVGDQPLSALTQTLPPSFMSPSMAPACADDKKYQAIEKIKGLYAARTDIAGRKITDRIDVNGIRLVLSDGSWILARASSNVPSLVIVIESTKSDEDKKLLFAEIKTTLATLPEVGAFDQEL